MLSLFEGVVDADVLGILSAQDEAPARVRHVDTAAWVTTLDRCAAFGLLTALGLGIYRLHPALPRYLRAAWRRDAGEVFEEEREATIRSSILAHALFSDWLDRQILGGKAEVAHAVLRIERRNLGAAVAAALDRELWSEAQSILQPLNELWKATGNVVEAGGWTIRCREVLEGPGGQSPDLDTEAGALWLFMVGAEANRQREAGRLEDAETTYDDLRRALEESSGETVKERLAITYHQIGMVAQDGGDLASAETWYRRSLDIVENLKDRPGMARSYHQPGRVAQDGGDLSSAEEWYRRSLEIKEELGNRPGMAYSYHQLGTVAQAGGDLASAETWYRRSLEITEALGARPSMALTYAQLGLLAEECGDTEQALEWTIRCVTLFSEIPHASTGTGPSDLVRWTRKLGWERVEATWSRITGEQLLEPVRRWIEARLEE